MVARRSGGAARSHSRALQQHPVHTQYGSLSVAHALTPHAACHQALPFLPSKHTTHTPTPQRLPVTWPIAAPSAYIPAESQRPHPRPAYIPGYIRTSLAPEGSAALRVDMPSSALVMPPPEQSPRRARAISVAHAWRRRWAARAKRLHCAGSNASASVPTPSPRHHSQSSIVAKARRRKARRSKGTALALAHRSHRPHNGVIASPWVSH